jgi:hypothetical protein
MVAGPSWRVPVSVLFFTPVVVVRLATRGYERCRRAGLRWRLRVMSALILAR